MIMTSLTNCRLPFFLLFFALVAGCQEAVPPPQAVNPQSAEPAVWDDPNLPDQVRITAIRESKLSKKEQGQKLIKFIRLGMSEEEVKVILGGNDIIVAEGVLQNKLRKNYIGYRIIIVYGTDDEVVGKGLFSPENPGPEEPPAT